MYPYRSKIIFVIFLLLIGCIAGRLFYLQIIESEKYKGISQTRRIRTYPLEAVRGTIFDRYGEALAIDHHTFDVSVKYKNLLYSYITDGKNQVPRISGLEVHKETKKACDSCHEGLDTWRERLSGILNVSGSELLEYAGQSIKKVERIKRNMEKRYGRAIRIKEESGYYPVISDISLKKAIQIEIEKNKIPGVRITPRPKRIYPHNDLASHVIGYMGKLTEKEWEKYSESWNNFVLNSSNSADKNTLLLYDGYAKEDFVGRAGVEAQYEEELRGLRGKRFEEITCNNAQIEKIVLERPPVPGNDLYLTIDSQIQAHAEKLLEKHVGAIIVMDPWTGEILAMANNPRFNTNTFSKDFNRLISDPVSPLLNRAIQGALPSGSIFKVITAIAALNENYIDMSTAFTCNGYLKYKDIVFRCWSNRGHGLVTIKDAIPHSCNVFFFETAKRIERDSLHNWAKKFGIGEKTGIDLLFEKTGNLPEIKTTATAMNVAIGQGALLTTPLQLVRLYAAIANGGTLVHPHVMLKVANKEGKVKAFNTDHTKKVDIDTSILEVVQNALREVVTLGTARDKGLDVYKVAGKTGTAETGRENDNHAWFAGYAPYDDPRYSFVVLVEHTPEHAGTITGPIVRDLMSFLFPEVQPSL